VVKICSVRLKNQAFKARTGDILLDAALVNGVNLPHDCRAGLCGSCLTRVAKGSTILGETAVPGMVHACQARILSDLEIEADEVPAVANADGRVTGLRQLAPDVIEVTIEPERRLLHLPGQYFKFKFDGFPIRSYSPTRPLERRKQGSNITLQVRRQKGGRVSGQLGREIRVAHPVAIEGPYGSAFLRPGKTGRLILISSGTGFAPIWSIAYAALRENPERPIVVIAGVRTADPIYMAHGLERIAQFPNVDILVTIGRRPSASEAVREGYPTDHLPRLSADDTVYACGPAQMIETLAPMVVRSKALFYSDPFEPAPETNDQPMVESAKRLKRFLIPEGGFGLPLSSAFPAPRTSS
jgi:CDP-4-dehydro-6-deoxyglucose reductase